MIRIATVLLIACAAMLAGCKKNQYVAPPPPKVTVAKPISKKIDRYVEATGTVQPIASVDLVARVQGYLQQIHFTDGQEVKKGDILFTIEPLPFQARLEQAQAAEAGAKAQLTNAEASFRRLSELQQRQVASVQNLDDARAARDSAQANLTQAQANTQLAAINYAYTRVLAPFDGRVTAHQVSVGQLVGATPTQLATVVQTQPIYATFNVSEQIVQRFRADLGRRGLPLSELQKISVEVGLQTETGYPHKGHIDYVSPLVDASTGTLTIRGIFDNAELGLLPGYFVRVRVPEIKGADAILVPDPAIGSDQSGRYVLVVEADGTVAAKPVKVGPRDGDLRVIESGLATTDRVIVSGLQRASPGQKVEAVER